MTIDEDIEKLMRGYEGVSALAGQWDVCVVCRDTLEAMGLEITGTCEYCGMQLIENEWVVRKHFDPDGTAQYSAMVEIWSEAKELHTPELCKDIRNGGHSVTKRGGTGCDCNGCRQLQESMSLLLEEPGIPATRPPRPAEYKEYKTDY